MRRNIVFIFAIIFTLTVNASSKALQPDDYINGLVGKLKEHSVLNSSLFSMTNLSVKLNIKIDEKGILSAQILSGSGNLIYDGSVMKNINQTAPFGPPPAALRDKLKRVGIELIVCSKYCPEQ